MDYLFHVDYSFSFAASVSSLGSPLSTLLSPRQRDIEKSSPIVLDEGELQVLNSTGFNIGVEVVKEQAASSSAAMTDLLGGAYSTLAETAVGSSTVAESAGAPSTVPETAGASTTVSVTAGASSTVNTVISSPTVAPPVKPSPNTPHENPDWLQDLKDNFSEEIILPCSARTRSAVEKNLYIEVNLGL